MAPADADDGAGAGVQVQVHSGASVGPTGADQMTRYAHVAVGDDKCMTAFGKCSMMDG